MRFELFKDVAGYWRWRLKGGNGEIVATSGESFASHYNALRAAKNVKVNVGSAALPTASSSEVTMGAAALRPRRVRRKKARRVRPSALR